MILTIQLAPEKEKALREEAARRGVSVEEYAKALLEESLPDRKNGSHPTLEEEEQLLDALAEVGRNLSPSSPGETYSRETIYAEKQRQQGQS